jgi:hypothetical protein
LEKYLKMSQRINIDSPRYDQSTFEGRAKYFFTTTNPLNVLASDEDLEKARVIVTSYRNGTEDKSLTEDEIWVSDLLDAFALSTCKLSAHPLLD